MKNEDPGSAGFPAWKMLLVFGYWFLVIGYWLLAVGFWLLAPFVAKNV